MTFACSVHPAPLVSVIVPVHRNNPRLLRATIRSVLSQTLTDFELIIIDDGMRPPLRVDTAVLSDQRVRLIRRATNKGPAAARNTGLAAAHGRFIAYCDSDDRWTPNHLMTVISYLRRHPRTGLVATRGTKRIIANKAYWQKRSGAALPKRSLLEQYNVIYTTSSVCHRKDCVRSAGMFDEHPSLRRGGNEDWEYWLRISDHDRIALLPNRTSTRYFHDKNVSLKCLFAAGTSYIAAKRLRAHLCRTTAREYLEQHYVPLLARLVSMGELDTLPRLARILAHYPRFTPYRNATQGIHAVQKGSFVRADRLLRAASRGIGSRARIRQKRTILNILDTFHLPALAATGQVAAALSLTRTLLAKDPGDPGLREMLAKCYFLRGDLSRTLRLTGQVRSPVMANLRGMCYSYRGEYRNAARAFAQAGTNPIARRNLRILKAYLRQPHRPAAHRPDLKAG